MCRLLVHWGPPVPVADLIVGAPHSLLRQCTDAREQSSGCTNPDGWGIGWWVDGQPDPFRYRSATAMPLDHDGLDAIDGLEAGRFIAHVRLKSPGSPTETVGNAPFVSGRWLFAHNGFVEGYRQGLADELFARLSPARQESLEGDADSEVLFGLVLDRIDAGADPADALGEVIGPLARQGGRYTVVLTDGERLLATRWANSLHRRGDPTTGAAFELASEPYDDRAGWQPVPDRTLVRLDADRFDLTPF
jgi:glutamine amidotransferase